MSQVTLRILGETVSLDAPEARGTARPDEILPFFYRMDDAAIGIAVRRVEARGEAVSCRKGCSACCRAQPVPVTPPEAYRLLLLVEAMTEPRRGRVLALFEANAARLREAGLDRHYLERDPNLTREQARAIAERYFELGLGCPFLENDACGIYEDRPFVCRQYLVTSPAGLCANPFENDVRPVPMPLSPATALLRVTAKLTPAPPHTIPLALALVYARTHRLALEAVYPAGHLLESMLREITA